MEYPKYFRLLNGYSVLKKCALIISFFFPVFLILAACDRPCSFKWPGQTKAAVCLSYDDALSSHLETAAPHLDQYGFKGTFFCTANSEAFIGRSEDWIVLAERGHELANHTVFHPCRKIKAGRDTLDWILPEYDLNYYTVSQLMEELRNTNELLQRLDGKKRRTFAYPCSDHQAGGQSYIDSLASICSAARAEGPIPQDLSELNLFLMPAIDASGKSGAELIQLAEQAKKHGTILTYIFHGVGGDYLEVSDTAHLELLDYLAHHPKDFWVGTFMEITDYLRDHGK